MLYGTDVRVSLTHFKKINSIGFFIILQNVKTQYKKNPFDDQNLKKFTEGNGQNLSFNFIIFFALTS